MNMTEPERLAVVLEWRDRFYVPADMQPMSYHDAEISSAGLRRATGGHYIPVYVDRLDGKCS